MSVRGLKSAPCPYMASTLSAVASCHPQSFCWRPTLVGFKFQPGGVESAGERRRLTALESESGWLPIYWKRIHLLYSVAVHRIKWKKGVCELGCGLKSVVEEISIDLDKLIGTSHILMEGYAFLLTETRMSLFLKQSFLQSPREWRLCSKY